MEPMTVRELLAATDGKLLGDVSLDTTISGVETDSRAVHDGDLFVAIRGENIDGHQFITGALEGGALGCLTAVPPKEAVPGKFYVLVEDTVQALGQVARAYKAKFPIPVIGVVNKIDCATPQQRADARELLELTGASPIFEISAKTGEGMQALLDYLSDDPAPDDAQKNENNTPAAS